MKKIVIVERDIRSPQTLEQMLRKHTEDGDQIVVHFGRRQGKTLFTEEFIKNMINGVNPQHSTPENKEASFFIVNKEALTAEEFVKSMANGTNPQYHSVNQKREAFGIKPLQSTKEKTTKKKDKKIKLSGSEIQSGLSRVDWAEKLILLLPEEHNGRNSWLLNYGQGTEAQKLRSERHLLFDSGTQSAYIPKKNE